MPEFFYEISDIKLFFLLSFVSVTISIVALYIVKRTISLELRNRNNSVIGVVSGLISIIYGVLAGLMALYLIDNISYTSDAVQREANAAANLYRDSHWLKDPVRTNIHVEIKNYLTKVINIEWPLMQEGKDPNTDADFIIDNISKELSQYKIANQSDLIVVRDMLEEIKSLYNARELRIHMSFASLNSEIWVVILLGTILTLAVNYLFGMNIYLHIATVIAAALMCSSTIFLLLTLDRPFRGEFVIDPSSLQAVLDYVEKRLGDNSANST